MVGRVLSQSLLNRGLFPTLFLEVLALKKGRNPFLIEVFFLPRSLREVLARRKSQSLLNRGLFPTIRDLDLLVGMKSQSLLNRGLFPTDKEKRKYFYFSDSRNPFLIEVFFLQKRRLKMASIKLESQSLLNRGLFPT